MSPKSISFWESILWRPLVLITFPSFLIEDTIDIFEIESLHTTEKDIELHGKFKERLKDEDVVIEDELDDLFDDEIITNKKSLKKSKV